MAKSLTKQADDIRKSELSGTVGMGKSSSDEEKKDETPAENKEPTVEKKDEEPTEKKNETVVEKKDKEPWYKKFKTFPNTSIVVPEDEKLYPKFIKALKQPKKEEPISDKEKDLNDTVTKYNPEKDALDPQKNANEFEKEREAENKKNIEKAENTPVKLPNGMADTIANAKPGDYFFDSDGTKHVITQDDINLCKETLKENHENEIDKFYTDPEQDAKDEEAEKKSIDKSSEETPKEEETKEEEKPSEEKPSAPEPSEKEKKQIDKELKDFDKHGEKLEKEYYKEEEKKQRKEEAEAKKAAKKAENEKLYKEWLKNPNKNVLSYIFSKNGVPVSSKVLAGLGMLAGIGGAGAEGAASGIRGTPTYTKPNTALADELAKQNETAKTMINNVLNAENNEEVARQERKSIIESNPYLKNLTDEQKEQIANSMLVNNPESKEALINKYFKDENLTEEQKDDIYRSYVQTLSSYKAGQEQRANELANQTLQQQNIRDKYANVNELMKESTKFADAIKDLDALKIKTSVDTKERFADIASKNLNALKGIITKQNLSTENLNLRGGFNKSGSDNVSGDKLEGLEDVSGFNIAKLFGLSFDADGGLRFSQSESKDGILTDEKGDYNYKKILSAVKKDEESVQGMVDEFNRIIDNQMKMYQRYYDVADEAARNAEAEYSRMTGKLFTPQATTKVNDGVIEPNGSEQILVRGNGENVELNPSDTVVAVKNPDDIFKLLGYGGTPINKDFDYYINLMRNA